jgi:hypothetical protein
MSKNTLLTSLSRFVSIFGTLVGIVMWISEAGFAAGPMFDLQVSPASATLNFESGQNCVGEWVAGPWFKLPQIQITWKGDTALDSLSLILAFQSPRLDGGLYICEPSQQEVNAVFGINGQSFPVGATLTSRCPIFCGQVKIVDFRSPLRIEGALTVVGRFRSSSSIKSVIQRQASVPVWLESSK